MKCFQNTKAYSLGNHKTVIQSHEAIIKITETGNANIVNVRNETPALGYHSSKNPLSNMFGAVPTKLPRPPSVDE